MPAAFVEGDSVRLQASHVLPSGVFLEPGSTGKVLKLGPLGQCAVIWDHPLRLSQLDPSLIGSGCWVLSHKLVKFTPLPLTQYPDV